LELDSQALSLPPASNGLRDFDAIAAARLSETEAWAAGDYWISEGSNVLVAGPLFERADTIVVLYTSWRVASYRILARHFKAELARNNRFPGLRNLYRFWRWSSRYYANAHPEGLNEW